MKTMNEVAEIMLKKGFESSDVNESGFLDELSWIEGLDFNSVNKEMLQKISKAMEEMDKPSLKTKLEYLEKIGEV